MQECAEAACDFLRAGGVGMNAVRQIECGMGDNTFEKEGIERDVVLPGESRIDGIKTGGVDGSEIAGCFHACKYRPDSTILDTADDGIEMGFDVFGRQTAKGVVGAECNNHKVRGLRQNPVDPGESACGSIAGDPGVDNLDIASSGTECGLKPGRQGLMRGESIAGGETVA